MFPKKEELYWSTFWVELHEWGCFFSKQTGSGQAVERAEKLSAQRWGTESFEALSTARPEPVAREKNRRMINAMRPRKYWKNSSFLGNKLIFSSLKVNYDTCFTLWDLGKHQFHIINIFLITTYKEVPNQIKKKFDKINGSPDTSFWRRQFNQSKTAKN